MSKSQRKLYNAIGSNKYFWLEDHVSQLRSVIRFAVLLLTPVAVIAIAELIFKV